MKYEATVRLYIGEPTKWDYLHWGHIQPFEKNMATQEQCSGRIHESPSCS